MHVLLAKAIFIVVCFTNTIFCAAAAMTLEFCIQRSVVYSVSQLSNMIVVIYINLFELI